ncbi:hypothetical protein Taro_028241 [Colocasia esculenta]|uniref:Thaumatin-like protein 1b n=1 Tax=Colocasia esculenta TaxID=4460 RepID=A0A843VAR0_COLES|nr:hypothetical protein [Colocasia esculenta]
MANRVAPALSFLCLHLLLPIPGVLSATFTFSNNCKHTVWPGLLSSAGSSPLSTTGFSLESGEDRSVSAPTGWSGRFWGRTHCSTDSATGKFTCGTADCGSGTVECSGSGAAPPATLAEFTLDGSGGLDFYDVSLVDGYNLPMLVVPQGAPTGAGGNCTTTGCLVDLNGVCPSELKVTAVGGEGVACRSACEAFGNAEYCCSGAYGNPNTCRPSTYSTFFKNACPRAYSYAYDDGTSTFTCAGSTSYHITFCPTTATSKSADGYPQAVSVPHAVQLGGGINSAMVYQGALVASNDKSLRSAPLMAATAVAAFWLALML